MVFQNLSQLQYTKEISDINKSESLRLGLSTFIYHLILFDQDHFTA